MRISLKFFLILLFSTELLAYALSDFLLAPEARLLPEADVLKLALMITALLSTSVITLLTDFQAHQCQKRYEQSTPLH